MSELKNIARIQIGPFGAQLHKEDYVEGGIPLINPSHIVNGECKPNHNLTISKEKHAELFEYHLEPGDIIMGRRGEMGRCAIIGQKEKSWLCGTGSLFLRPNLTGFLSEYLYSLLTSKAIKQFLERESLGATMPNLNKSIIGKIQVPLPDKLTVERYVKIKSKIMENRTDQFSFSQQSLFSSLSQKAFAGEL